MDKIKLLESKKILKELEYVETDFEYKNSIISEVDSEFIGDVNKFLENHPELKELFDQKMDKRFESMIKDNEEKAKEEDIPDVEEVPEENIEEEIIEPEDELPTPKVEKSAKVKKLYRDIVKLTHPDKVDSIRLNELYLKATQYYDEDDLTGLYSICSELNIEYEIEESDNVFINDKIAKLKEKIVFLESTFTWKWYSTQGLEDKNKLILTYIQLQLSSM